MPVVDARARTERAERAYATARRLLASYRRVEAEAQLRRALAHVDAGGTGLRRERVLLTLAAVRAELGHLDEGLALLATVEERVVPGDEVHALVPSQRAALLFRAGRHADALPHFDEAARRIADDPGSRAELGILLLNRASCQLSLGRVDVARADYLRCIEVSEGPGREAQRMHARTGLAYVDYVRGDVPAALAGLDRLLADDAVTEVGVVAELRLMRADALLAGGLLAEADAELRSAVTGFAALRLNQDRAECEALQAQVALTDDRPGDAVALARRARRRFERRGSVVWAQVAELVELQARLVSGRAPAEVAEAAARLSSSLREAGLVDDACLAALIAARAHVRAGDREAADRWAALGAVRHAGRRVLTGLQASAARAELAAAAGERRRADAHLRSGLRSLHRYQATFGSLDAQTAVVRHGRELVQNGLAAALADGDAGRVFSWAEEGRALASRLPPARPPDDPEAARLLQELRLVRLQQRQAQLAGSPDAELDRWRESLERRVRQRSWHASGAGDVERPAGLPEVRSALARRAGAVRGPLPADRSGAPGSARAGEAGGALVAHLVVAGSVRAVVVTARATRLVSLGDAATVTEALRRVGADLDALAVRGYPPAMRERVRRSLGRGLAALDDLLWAPVAALAGGGPVVLVPAGTLVAVPWTALPGLAGRVVTVARSATAWCRPPAGAPPARPDAVGRAVVAGGPDLLRADEEVAAVAALWPEVTALTGDDARGGDLVDAAAGATMVHVAAHGVHEPANPLFSALRLADGPLFGYDLGRLGAAAPAHVVLSACDLGRAAPRPGDEVLGMTAALLHAGTGAVVASVAQVNDDVACDVLVDYHRRLRAGAVPAQALAGAIEGRDDAPFLCFGAGW